jgi:hypothetical protein
MNPQRIAAAAAKLADRYFAADAGYAELTTKEEFIASVIRDADKPDYDITIALDIQLALDAKEERLERIRRDAQLAYESHYHVAQYTPDRKLMDVCMECGEDFGSAIHLRKGETRKDRIDSFLKEQTT